MKDRVCFRKSVIALAVVTLLAVTGVFGLSAVPAWASAVVNTEGINVRQSPVDGEAVDTLPEGKSVTIVDTTVGSDGNTWDQITYSAYGSDDLGGWVRADFLTSDGETAAAEAAEEAEAAAEEAAEEAEAAAEEAVTSEEEAEAIVEEAADQETVASNSSGVSYVIASSIPADAIPDGFQKTTVSYEGKDVPALVMNSAEVYLLYMEDTSNTAPGRLVVYDLSKAELIPYICFETDDGFILLLNIPDAELASVSDRFALVTCEFDGGTMDALQMTQKDSVISESANLTDFYYMYGVNRDGMYGWYVYDKNEGTIQENVLSMHYNLNGTTEGVEERSGFSLDSLSVAVIVGIVVIFALLVVLVIIFGLRYRQLAHEMEEMQSRKSRRSSGSSSGGGSGKSRKSPGGGSRSSASRSSDSSPYDTGMMDSGSMDQSTRTTSQSTQSFDFSSGSGTDTFDSTTAPLKQDAADSQASRKSSRNTAKNTDPDDDDLTFL